MIFGEKNGQSMINGLIQQEEMRTLSMQQTLRTYKEKAEGLESKNGESHTHEQKIK